MRTFLNSLYDCLETEKEIQMGLADDGRVKDHLDTAAHFSGFLGMIERMKAAKMDEGSIFLDDVKMDEIWNMFLDIADHPKVQNLELDRRAEGKEYFDFYYPMSGYKLTWDYEERKYSVNRCNSIRFVIEYGLGLNSKGKKVVTFVNLITAYPV